MEARIELITPQIAEQYLAKNSNNYRRLYKATVEQYASEMLNGEWIFNGEAIKFNKSGKLVDGQHRLSAIVKSGCSVPMVVITDVNDDVNTYLTLGHKGNLLCTAGEISVVQAETQQQSGGLTDMYKENGTYM